MTDKEIVMKLCQCSGYVTDMKLCNCNCRGCLAKGICRIQTPGGRRCRNCKK